MEDITENIILKKNILLNKKKNELNETSDSKKIFNKKNKNKNFEGVKFKFNENNKEKNDKKNSYFNGIFHRSTNKKKPLAVHSKLNAENNEIITDISSGSHHSFAINCKNEVYGWGYSNKGQLGMNFCEDTYKNYIQCRIAKPKKIDK